MKCILAVGRTARAQQVGLAIGEGAPRLPSP
jgi:hypothetical protein